MFKYLRFTVICFLRFTLAGSTDLFRTEIALLIRFCVSFRIKLLSVNRNRNSVIRKKFPLAAYSFWEKTCTCCQQDKNFIKCSVICKTYSSLLLIIYNGIVIYSGYRVYIKIKFISFFRARSILREKIKITRFFL